MSITIGKRKWSLFASLGIVVVLVMSACGEDSSPPPTVTATPTQAPPATITSATSAPTATASPRPTNIPAPTATPVVPTGTLNVALASAGSEAWVPRLIAGEEHTVMTMFAEALVGNNSATRTFRPQVAETWSVDVKPSGAAVWTFTLRPNTPFHENNGIVTSEDIKFTLGEYLKPDARPGAVGVIRSSLDRNIDNVQIVSPTEFKINAPRLDVNFLQALSFVNPSVTVSPKKYYESVGDDGFSAHPIGTGPFNFKSQQKGVRVTLEALPKHYRATASVKTVNVLFVPDAPTRVAMLKVGQADIAALTKPFKAEMKAPRLKSFSSDRQSLVFLTLGGMYYDLPDKNCTSCPWVGYTDKALKVRQAINMSIDRKAIIDKLLVGEGVIASAPYVWTPGPFAYNDLSWPLPEYDPAKAKQLLAEAGFANGFPLDFPIFPSAGFPEQVDVSEVVAGYLEAIGIKISRMPMEFSPNWQKRMGDRTTGGAAWVFNNGYRDEPLTTLAGSLSKTSATAYLHDPEIEKVLTSAGAEPDINKRMAMYRALGKYFIDNTLAIPLFTQHGVWGASSRVLKWELVSAYPYLNSIETVVMAK